MWSIIGMLILAWSAWAIFSGITSAMWEPSTGGAAGCAVIIGFFAVIVGGILTWVLL